MADINLQIARGERFKRVLEPLGSYEYVLTEMPILGRQAPSQLDELTAREREVMALAAAGLSNGKIADQLVISAKTAKTHISRVMAKLGAHHRAQLVTLAHETGLVHAGTRRGADQSP